MGKWNKAPPQVSEQFLQNQQRRKQMIIQAAKRRKEKQKKLQQQVEIQKKNQQQALLKHKQQKKDAYVKYLRNNMHDKYEQMKRNQKLSQPEVRSKSKWKKDTLESNSQMGSQIRPQQNLQGLDLQVNITTKNNRVSNNRIVNNKVGGQVVRNVPESSKAATYFQKQQPNRWGNNNGQHSSYSANNNNKHKQVSKSPAKKQSQKRRLLQDEFQNMRKQDNQVVEQKQFDYELSVQETIFDDMMGSKLLDSLDLDLDTVSRGKKLDKQLKEQKKKNIHLDKSNDNREIDEIKKMIGYESVLMSIDERSELRKKYNQFMVNEIPGVGQGLKNENDNNHQQQNATGNNKAFSNDKGGKNTTTKANQSKNDALIEKISKPMNEGQVFNQLKNKKEGKILNWAQGQAQQADDLFSNCSTNKKSKTRGFELLKEINKQIQQKGTKKSSIAQGNQEQSQTSLQQQPNMKKKQRPLQTIPEKKINSSLQKIRQRSFDKKQQLVTNNQTGSATNLTANTPNNRSHQIKRSASKQKVQPSTTVTQVNKPRINRINSAQNNKAQPPQPPRNSSKQRVNKTATNSFKQLNNGDSSRINQNMTQQPRGRVDSSNRRSLSKQKEGSKSQKQIPSYGGYSRNPPLKVQQTIGSARNIPPAPTKKLPHLPPTMNYRQSHDQITIATQDQLFQVQSFIKNQLLSINKQQRQLQQDLKNIHLQSKYKLKQVEKKYEIKTDYKYSYEIRQKQEGQNYYEEDQKSVGSYRQAHKKQTQDQLQESIQRLDDMLLRKEIINKQKNRGINEQENESQSTHKSLINPMTDPITLHKQVLQLAQNLSRFEGQPQDPSIGYGAKIRMKKKSMQKENKRVSKDKDKDKGSGGNNKEKKQTQIQLSESQDVNMSQLNTRGMHSHTNNNNSKSHISRTSKVSSKVQKPPQLEYSGNNGNPNIPAGYNQSDILDDDDYEQGGNGINGINGDEMEDSIEKGKIQVNERLRRILLE